MPAAGLMSRHIVNKSHLDPINKHVGPVPNRIKRIRQVIFRTARFMDDHLWGHHTHT